MLSFWAVTYDTDAFKAFIDYVTSHGSVHTAWFCL